MVFPLYFWLLFAAALLISAIGFKKYVWFISLGYGFSIAGEGILMMILYGIGQELTLGTVICCALLGYIGIIFVMFSGARRLEIRQNKNCGSDPAYREYVKTVPILVPFIPLYSVEKYKWLVA